MFQQLKNVRLLPLTLISFRLDQAVNRCIQRCRTLEVHEFHDEQVGENVAAELADQLAGSLGRATGCDQVVHDEHVLTGFHRVALHFEFILLRRELGLKNVDQCMPCRCSRKGTHNTVLLPVGINNDISGKFTLFPDRNERAVQSCCEHGSEEETAGVEAGDNVDLGVGSQDVVEEVGYDSFNRQWVLEDRHDVLEHNTLFDQKVGWRLNIARRIPSQAVQK